MDINVFIIIFLIINLLTTITITLINNKFNKNKLSYNCNKNNSTEPFAPYNDSYTEGFSVKNVLCSNLNVSKTLNSTADIIIKSIDNIKIQEESNKELKTLLQALYPKGSIYMSMDSTNPETFIGGKWTQISNKFLYCATTDSTKTGGSDTVTLTTDNLPSHNHSAIVTCGTASINHRHGIYNIYDNQDLNQHIKYSGWNSSIPDDGGNKYSRTTYTNYSDPKHTHNISCSIGNTGGGKSFSILPSYIKIYCWYRTA